MQSKNQNDSVQLSTRYQQYDFAKRHLGGFGGRQVFPIRGICEKIDGLQSASNREQERISSNTKKEEWNKPSIEDRRKYEGRLSIRQLNNPTHSNDRVYSEEGISPTLNTAQGGNRQPFIPVLTPDRLVKRQKGRRFKEAGDAMFTLNTQDKHGIYDGIRIRRLTPLECERLMGLPDNWTEGVSDAQRYKLCGNGVVVSVVKEIIKQLI